MKINGRDSILNQIEEEIQSLIDSYKRQRLIGIGFGLPGRVDILNDISIYTTRIKDWRNVSFKKFAAKYPVIALDNIANCKAVGERFMGYGKNIDDFLYLNIGNGAGMGIYINGEIYRGHDFTAGESGHIILDENSGNICICGNRGCFESFVSNKAIINQLIKLKKNEVESELFADPDFGNLGKIYEQLHKYHKRNDKVAFLIINELAHKLGLACANFINLFAPEYIFIGGPISVLGESILELIVQNVRKYCLQWQQQRINIAFSYDYENVGAVGLGLLVFEKYLMGPGKL